MSENITQKEWKEWEECLKNNGPCEWHLDGVPTGVTDESISCDFAGGVHGRQVSWGPRATPEQILSILDEKNKRQAKLQQKIADLETRLETEGKEHKNYVRINMAFYVLIIAGMLFSFFYEL